MPLLENFLPAPLKMADFDRNILMTDCFKRSSLYSHARDCRNDLVVASRLIPSWSLGCLSSSASSVFDSPVSPSPFRDLAAAASLPAWRCKKMYSTQFSISVSF